ncbi:MAG: helix-turn-helix transcriptional regulator [Gammaproteobacteria bacterium]|nr:helix-turn-helix transcriptional regulator [Gammaproteobacteria bacterium]
MNNRTMTKQAIFDTLSHSNATLRGELRLPGEIRLAAWQNELDRVSYHTDEVHTLSLYTAGGEQTYRLDGRRSQRNGFKDAICIIPQQQESVWEIQGRFEFTHLYFTDSHLREFIARELDLEPRLFALPDHSFLQHIPLAAALQQLGQPQDWHDDIHQLHIQSVVQNVFAELCKMQSYRAAQKVRIYGGLSLRSKKTVQQYIEDNLQHSITIADIASTVGLSEYHFARAFRQSFYTSVHRYIESRRVQRVRDLLTKGQKLIDIADAAGFSDQSHLSRVVKRQTGVTPKSLKRYLNGQPR